VTEPVKSAPVVLFTLRPARRKLWRADRSRTTILNLPALTEVELSVAFPLGATVARRVRTAGFGGADGGEVAEMTTNEPFITCQALKLIAERPRSTQELAPLVGISEAGLSKHLRQLTEAVLLESRREGYYVFYSLVPERIEPLSESLRRFLSDP
jgi:DNA-binding transcriptional ArsR family regulator